MGKRGPVKRPTNVAILHGVQPSRLNVDAPVAPDGKPDAPQDMTPAGLLIWHRTVDALARMGTLSPADREALIVYVEAVTMFQDITTALAKDPSPMIPGTMGGYIRNPLYAMKRDAATLVRIMAREFGLTPSARSDISVGAAAKGHAGDGPERLLS